MRLFTKYATAMLMTALLAGSALAPASARPLERGHFHDVGRDVIRGFCDDLTVLYKFDVSGSFVFVPQGRNRLAHDKESVHGQESWTNLDNDQTLTHRFNVHIQDLKVTNNGDGTLTILVKGSGSDKWFGPNGTLVFNDPGQTRWEILIDHGGTPADPSDDEFLKDLGIVKGSTGRNDTEGRDFCADVHDIIG